MAKKVNIIFPHQLFEDCILLKNNGPFYLIEEFLFFKQYEFHKQKIAFHRASMKFYESYLKSLNKEVHYIDSNDKRNKIETFLSSLNERNEIAISEINDNWLSKRINNGCKIKNLKLIVVDSPYFINQKKDLKSFFYSDKKKFYQTSFYIEQRKKHNILINKEKQAIGGKWSFDTENRKKYPKGKEAPSIKKVENDSFFEEAYSYVEKYFYNNPGQLDKLTIYPYKFDSSKAWLYDFLENRLDEFGVYEDAIVDDQHFLNHSVISPMLNVGLLTPKTIINKTIKIAQKKEIPINSLEGFIRQIIGWREFIRGVYIAKGSQERTTNFFNHKTKMPKVFYDGSTGIEPIDNTIKKLNKTAYSHHIERLMILGNFMLLCEIDPDDIYKWFMELYIDAYDWVMVPNVYGMSQFADGGLMSTKPYISSSNYIKKMSNYKKGDWQKIWDALYWRFINKHRVLFSKNIRMNFMIKLYDKKTDQLKQEMEKIAQEFLNHLE
jgi:deoxyribodipyrimidine photolyase-related protein